MERFSRNWEISGTCLSLREKSLFDGDCGIEMTWSGTLLRLFCTRWIEDCASSHDTRAEEEKKPGEPAPLNLEALTELLERIDVTRSGAEEGIAHEAMRKFWELRPDYREFVTFDHEFWKELDSQQAFVARTLNDYCNQVEDDGLHDDKMPEITMFAFVVEKHLNSLMELVDKLAVMEEDDPEAEEAQEDVEEQDFIVQQLLHIALTLDYSDEVGRRQMYNIMRSALARAQLPEECTKLAVEVLRECCGHRGEADFCAVILEAIAEVRDTLMDDDATETGEDAEESFHSAQSDVSENEGAAPAAAVPKKKARQLDPEEEEEKRIREVMVYSKCLHIAQCTLQNVHCDLESDNSLTTILNTLIIPAVRGQEAMIRERGVICLGLGALLSKVCLTRRVLGNNADCSSRTSPSRTWICSSTALPKVTTH
jgi:condensin complex subunit 3